MEGKGIYFYSQGGKYEGDFMSGLMDGYGIQKCEDGSKYEGNWKKDKKEGEGTYHYANNGGVYKGAFKNDMMCG